MFLICLLKKPLFELEYEGPPFSCAVFFLALSHEMAPPLLLDVKVSSGVLRPLPSRYGLVRPGLDQPPSSRGDGLRERDIEVGILGVPTS